MIVTLLILLTTGRKPDRATARMVGRHLLGLATEDDLLAFLNEPDNAGVKRRAKDELWKKLGLARRPLPARDRPAVNAAPS